VKQQKQVICTFKQGRIADRRGLDAQQFRASGLNLVIAAIVHWNSTYVADAVDVEAHRLLGRLSLGSRCRHSGAASAAEPQPRKDGG
jgi:TnpA family transposase